VLPEHAISLEGSSFRLGAGGYVVRRGVEFASGLNELRDGFEEGTAMREVFSFLVLCEELREGLGVGVGSDDG
jgi:hypothetical protein